MDKRVVSCMGKKLDEKTIRKLLEEGWRFSKKNVGKYIYIRSRRKGEESHHGRFDGETWAIIEHHQNNKPNKWKRLAILNNEFIEKTAIARAEKKSKTCIRIKDGYCTFWEWPRDSNVINAFTSRNEFLKDNFKRDVDRIKELPDGNVILKPRLLYCKDCSSFLKKMK